MDGEHTQAECGGKRKSSLHQEERRARSACRQSLVMITVTVATVLLGVGWHGSAHATRVNFTIDFTQTSGPPSAGAPPTGSFSIEDTLLNTGADQFLYLTTVPDFEIVDGAVVFPSSVWFGSLHIPPFGLSLHVQGLATDDPGSNAIAELFLPSNDPSCLGVAVAASTHCEFALGSDYSWGEVLFDSTSNLAVATGSYSVAPVPEPRTSMLFGAGIVGLIIVMRKRERR